MARLLRALKHMLYTPLRGMMMRHYDLDTSLILPALTTAAVCVSADSFEIETAVQPVRDKTFPSR